MPKYHNSVSGPKIRRTLVVALLAALPSAVPGRVVTGRVFLDADGDGRRGPGERGIAGVRITDGVQFVRSDTEGTYRIDARVDPLVPPGGRPILSVCFPTGCWPTAGWFRRIDDRKTPGGVDFALRADKQKLPFTFVHATDPHMPADKGKFVAFRKEIRGLAGDARFCVLTGDLVSSSDRHGFAKAKAQYDFLAGQLRDFPLPLFCVPGNHDAAGVNALVGWKKDDPMYGCGFYCRVVGPLRWSFDYAGVHFVGVDFARKVAGRWRMGVSASAVAWLAEDLRQVAPAARIFLFVHYPQGVRDFPRVLKKYKVAHIFAGHKHAVRHLKYSGIPVTLSGSLYRIYAQPGHRCGYRLVTVKADGLDMQYRAVGGAVATQPAAPPVGPTPRDLPAGRQKE